MYACPTSDALIINFFFTDCSDGKGTGSNIRLRRLSTISSVLAANGHIFRTRWKWYWKDEHDKWQSFDDGKNNTSSEKIELDFQSESVEKKHKFSTDLNNYTLHFVDQNQFYQQNDKHGTKRDVRRRPAQFLDADAMKQMRQDLNRSYLRRPVSSSNSKGEAVTSIPSNWAPVDFSKDFQVVDLSEVIHNAEFSKVKTQFLATMAGHTVKSIKRVQNITLWEDYQRQKSKIMTKNSGVSPDKRWLFHGTNKDTIDPICQQGFDWRLSGKHGAVYGTGSYFATEASYSHTYSSGSSFGNFGVANSRMFLANVIVGSYVVGNTTTKRPPPKDTSNPLSVLHDSCVNNVNNPTIFVVFERSQAYPYYIIEYG